LAGGKAPTARGNVQGEGRVPLPKTAAFFSVIVFERWYKPQGIMEFDFSPLWISVKTALLATIFAFFLGIAAAYWMFWHQGKGRGLIDSILTLPLVLPPTVVGFVLLLLLGRNSPIGQLLKQLGINLIFTWSATVIAATVVAFPLMYKTALGSLEQVDPDLSRVARTLGATERRIFWQVLLPLAYPGVVAGTILAFARALGEFGATLMLAGSVPGKTQTIPIAIFVAAQAGEMGQALGWVLIMIAIALAVITSLNSWSTSQYYSKKGNTAVARLFDCLILGQPLARETRGRGDAVTRGCGRISVDLQKNLSGFTLETSFTSASAPLGILGASGSGKSMTLRCIAGLETPTQGRIILNERVLFDSQLGINLPSYQRRIGFVFQNYALFPHLSVAQNIAFGLQRLSKAERAQRVASYMDLMQLQGLEARYPHQLSGGQQQRVALARALAIEPEALLLDEPLSALDTYLRSQIEKLLAEVLSSYQGVTLFITHKLEEAYRVCNNLLVLSEGKIIAHGPKADIFERPPTYKVAQLTECKNFSRIRVVAPQLVEALDWGCTIWVMEPVSERLTYIGIRAHHFSFPQEPNLENTFPCWLAQTSETQDRITIYLKLDQPPSTPQDYHLQAELFKEKWNTLKERPQPWKIQLAPQRLFLMAGGK
jgi:molybdate transport system permease protein